MFQVEILILEFLSVNRLSSSSIECGEVSSLYHEVFDHPVEDRS